MAKREIAEFKSVIDASAEDTYRWHGRPGTFKRLIPPWESVVATKTISALADGETAILQMQLGPATLEWVAEHCDTQEGKQFTDVQTSGPFAFWRHVHKFEPRGSDQCEVIDRIEYELPAAMLSNPVMGDSVRDKIKRMFKYRHEITASDLKFYKEWGGRSMKVLVTGSHGMVGSQLIAFLTSQGQQVTKLVRSYPQQGDLLWDPANGKIDASQLEGFDAVVHLAGDNIADGRWTDAKKAEIRKSRVQGTRALSEALASLSNPPSVLVSASAIGIYGDRGDELVTEASAPATDFLSQVCAEWEAATKPAKDKGIRVVNLRIGVVLSTKGGALKKMLPPFLVGAGGRLGSGKQYMSWVTLDDLVGIIQFAITHKELQGPVNAVAPNAVTNSEFTSALGAAIHRPTIFPVPSIAVQLLFGEMADVLLLSGARIKPEKLITTGYSFRHPDVGPALKSCFGAA